MYWSTTDERYHEALRRLAVVLLALAVLAERAARRSWPVRHFVLCLLRRAETLARDFAAEASADALPLPGEYPVCPPGGPGEATRLAQAFRALAAVFFALSHQAVQWLRIARRHRCRPGVRRHAVRRIQHASQRSYADTS
jgi:hypothetical protein